MIESKKNEKGQVSKETVLLSDGSDTIFPQ